MAFLPNIPQPNDQQNVSQGDILNNFTILGAIAGNANTSSDSLNPNSGFNWVYLPNNGAIPPAGSSFSAGTNGVYSATNPNTGLSEVYVNKQSAGPLAKQVPMTASIFGTNAAPAVLSAGWSYLPSGLLLKWAGNVNATAGLSTILFPASGAIPAYTTCLTVLVCIADGGAGDINRALIVKNVTPASFDVYASQRTSTTAASVVFTYFAIGY